MVTVSQMVRLPPAQVQTAAAEAKKAAVAQLHQQVQSCQAKAVKQCEAALSPGWADGLPADPQLWAGSLMQRYEECKAEDSLASFAQEQV